MIIWNNSIHRSVVGFLFVDFIIIGITKAGIAVDKKGYNNRPFKRWSVP